MNKVFNNATVRFNLGRGKNYMKWKITTKSESLYIDPYAYSLMMVNATLKNNANVANKIKDGANKSVCSWVKCDEVILDPVSECCSLKSTISYNPRVSPYWRDEEGNNIDGFNYNILITINKQIFKL